MSLNIFVSQPVSHSRPPNNHTLWALNIPVLKATTSGKDELGALGHSQGEAWAAPSPCLGGLCPCSLASVRKALHFIIDHRKPSSSSLNKDRPLFLTVQKAEERWLLPGLQNARDIGAPGFFWSLPHGCRVAAVALCASSSHSIQRQGGGLTSKNVSLYQF